MINELCRKWGYAIAAAIGILIGYGYAKCAYVMHCDKCHQKMSLINTRRLNLNCDDKQYVFCLCNECHDKYVTVNEYLKMYAMKDFIGIKDDK